MALLVFFLLCAFIFGGIGVFIEGFKFCLIFAAACFIASVITGRNPRI